jgi:outer membrane protein OmpA-like peptidoglycan-associated protein
VLVGHTDNQGALDANLTLSQQRAHAVAEEGRARNRRVELIVP